MTITQKHCGNIRVRKCKCGHDQKLHFGRGKSACKFCECEKYEFGHQEIWK